MSASQHVHTNHNIEKSSLEAYLVNGGPKFVAHYQHLQLQVERCLHLPHSCNAKPCYRSVNTIVRSSLVTRSIRDKLYIYT